MKETIYLETTIPSYLTSRPSKDIVLLAHQQISQQWWKQNASDYDIFISELVIQEASRGDTDAAQKRLDLIKPFSVLDITPEVERLVEIYQKDIPILKIAAQDGLHLAIASAHGMDYLLTWNCNHIAHGATKKSLYAVNQKEGIKSPTICTPEEMLKGE